MSPRQIIEVAYSRELMPPQLHGRTQHKTLGARLSEDILSHRERSVFFRTAPGRFFLTRFLHDDAIDKKYREPIIARRRQRELARGRNLTLPQKWVEAVLGSSCLGAKDFVRKLSTSNYYYASGKKTDPVRDFTVWVFVSVIRDHSVLTYRHGRYSENRDSFLQRRSVGFYTPVVEIDADLFESDNLGMCAAGLKAIVMDLDLPTENSEDYKADLALEQVVMGDVSSKRRDVLAVAKFKCPTWFEPLRRHLTLNDLRWMDLRTPINNLDDFDPWSRRVLSCLQETTG